MLTFIDLFAGIGGFRLGMEMAGHRCVGHCEIDKFANRSYMAMHNPREDEWCETDIRTVRADDMPRADVWCFGFPCQDISVAGKQAGFKGNRSSLFFTATRLIRDLKEEDRPKYLLIENVKNLLSVNRGGDFLKLQVELDEIGYDAEWDVLNSKHFGVPQNRERVFIVGHLRGRSARQVFPIRETDEIHNSSEADGEVHKVTAGGNDKWQGVYIVKQIGNCMPTSTRENPNQGRIYDPTGIAPCLNRMEGGGREPIIIDTQGRISKAVPKPKDVCPTLRAHAHGNVPMVVPVCDVGRTNKNQNGRRFKESGDPMFTLTGQDRHGVAISTECASRIRKLTPRECFRLQGFPDKYFDRAKEVNSDSQLYRQAGSSVTVNVIYEIAKRLV